MRALRIETRGATYVLGLMVIATGLVKMCISSLPGVFSGLVIDNFAEEYTDGWAVYALGGAGALNGLIWFLGGIAAKAYNADVDKGIVR